MRVVKLVHGAGDGVSKACLMTASNMLIGQGENRDQNSCVCRILQAFIVITNDNMPLEILSDLYGPLVWEILGTTSDDEAVQSERSRAMVNWLIREAYPTILDLIGDPAAQVLRDSDEMKAYDRFESRKMRDLLSAGYRASPNSRVKSTIGPLSANLSGEVVDNKGYNYVGYFVAQSFVNILSAVAEARDDFDALLGVGRPAPTVFLGAGYPASEQSRLGYAEYLARYSAFKGRVNECWKMCPDIIRRVAAIGDKRPVETVITCDDLAGKLTSSYCGV